MIFFFFKIHQDEKSYLNPHTLLLSNPKKTMFHSRFLSWRESPAGLRPGLMSGSTPSPAISPASSSSSGSSTVQRPAAPRNNPTTDAQNSNTAISRSPAPSLRTNSSAASLFSPVTVTPPPPGPVPGLRSVGGRNGIEPTDRHAGVGHSPAYDKPGWQGPVGLRSAVHNTGVINGPPPTPSAGLGSRDVMDWPELESR